MYSIIIVNTLRVKGLDMTTTKPIAHRGLELVRNKIVDKIEKARQSGLTFDEIAKLCGTSKPHIHDLYTGEKGINLSLNIAFKIWEGLGENLIDLVCDLDPDLDWSRMLNMSKEDREVVAEVIQLFDTPDETPEKRILRQIIMGLNKPGPESPPDES